MNSIMHNPAHPGAVLREWMDGRSVTSVAEHIGVSRITLSRVLNESAGVSPEMSLRLSQAFGTSPNLFFNMQAQYDFWVASQSFRRRKPIPRLLQKAG